ncbi:MAG: 2-C-methyl-D-erythritol 4-phosphate cytidylyltransferase [Clostridiales bacterium]|nr:MAG: 2-C-methyl-D-erythritol 4-phosphate cytidylyltransferase [Clostridiales bacterium]
MNDFSLRELQQKSLEIALYFKEFCNEHGLLFFMCGGCCIGALRHKGFIPWDDDVDVFMPRDDYEKLKRLWPEYANTEKYSCVFSDKTIVDGNLFITIRDNETTAIKPYQTNLDISHGVALDVLPLDGWPDSSIKRKFQVFWALIYSIYCAQTVPVNHGKAVTLCGKIALSIIPSKKLRYKIWKLAERKMTKYKINECDNITELCSGPYYMKKQYPRSAFDKALWVDFENVQMPIPEGYDIYLKTAFGDYMQMPPPEKQKPHHDAVFIDLHNTYKKYKGIHYLTERDDLK